jgi:hypothetical protein
MKSRVINTFRALGPWPPRAFSRLRQRGVLFGGTLCVLTLSGCYYPYGYYPAGYYPAYYSPYATVPATAAQQEVPVGQSDPASAQQNPQATYPVAAPPVYVAPAYPAYYPPPVYPAYPAYYGYPGYFAPSLSIGIGGYWGGGWGHHHGH